MAGVNAVDSQKLNVLVHQINKVVGITIKFGEGGAPIKPPSMPDDLFDHYEVQYLMCEESDSTCDNTNNPEDLDWNKSDTVLFDQLDGELTITGLIPGRVYWFRTRAWSVEGGVGEKWFYENFAAAALSVSAPTSLGVTPVTTDPRNTDFGKVTFSCNYTYNALVSRIEIWDKAYDASDAKIIASIPIEDFTTAGSSSSVVVFVPEFNNQMTTIEYYFYAVDINTNYSAAAHGTTTQLKADNVNIDTYYPQSADTYIVSDKDNFIIKLDVLDISDIFSYSKYRYKSKKVTDSNYGDYSAWSVGTDTIILPNHDAGNNYLQYILQYQVFDKYNNVYNLDNDISTNLAIAGTDLTPPKMVSPLNVYGPYFNENFDEYEDGRSVESFPGDWDRGDSDANIPETAYSYVSGSTTEKDGGKCLVLPIIASGEDSDVEYYFSTNIFVNFAYLFRFRFSAAGHPLYAYFHMNDAEGIKLTINQGGTVVLTREHGGDTILSYSYGAFTVNVWYNVLIITMGFNKDEEHDQGAITVAINGSELIPAINTEFHDNCSQQGTATELYLDTDTSSTSDDHYYGMYVRIINGTATGMEAVITGYTGSTHKCTLDRTLSQIPDTTSEYYIMQLPYINIPSDGNGYIEFLNPAGSGDVCVDNIEIYKNDYMSS